MAPTLSLPTLPKRADTTVPRSQAERLWLIGGGIVILVLLLIGFFFFISPQRSQTSAVNSQVTAAQAQNSALEAHLAALREQSKGLAKYEAQLKTAQQALPSGADVANFLRALQSLGSATQTNVANMTVGAATPVTPAAPPGATAAAAPTAAAGPNTAPASEVLSYTISIQVSGTPVALNRFLEQLQAVQPRAILITQLSESTGTGGPGVNTPAGGTSLQLSMQAFASGPPTVPTVGPTH